jgi:hypothetical protein
VLFRSAADFASSSTRRLDAQLNNPSFTTLPAGWQGNSASARWTGDLIAQFTENHTFYIKTNGGVRLWFNDELVLDDWSGSTSRELSFTRALSLTRALALTLTLGLLALDGKAVDHDVGRQPILVSQPSA